MSESSKRRNVRKMNLPPNVRTRAMGGVVTSTVIDASQVGGINSRDIITALQDHNLQGNIRFSPYNDSPHTMIGDLNGYYGYSAATYGIGIGQYATGEVNVTIDATNGLRIRYYDTDKITLDASGDATFTGEITAASGSIASWTINSDNIASNNATLHSDGYIALGTGDDYARLDAADATYRLWIGDSVAGDAPFSVTKDGDVVANNLTAQGNIKTAVFEKSYVTATAGSLLITKSAGKLESAYTVGGNLTIEDPDDSGDLFGSADVVRITGVNTSGTLTTSWVTVDPSGTTNVYTTTYQSGGSTETYPAGLVAVDYGGSADGLLMLTADESNAPYYSVETHDGSPWTSTTTVGRYGNMNGAFGVSGDYFGLGVGDYSGGNYLKYDSNGGLVLRGGDAVEIDSSGITVEAKASLPDPTGPTEPTTVKWVDSTPEVAYLIYSIDNGDAYHMAYGADPEIRFRVYYDKSSPVLKANFGIGYDNLTSNANFTIVDNIGGSASPISIFKAWMDGSADYITMGGDLRVDQGLYVGAENVDPDEDDAWIAKDVRIGGGLYVGATDTDPDADGVVVDGDITAGGAMTATGNITSSAFSIADGFRMTHSGEVTISSGTITIAGPGMYGLDTESDDNTDDLDGIAYSSGSAQAGDIVVIHPVSDDRAVVIRDSQGNIICGGNENMNGSRDTAIMIYWAGLWMMASFHSNN